VLSITSNYYKDTGCPAPYLKRIADAGFTHIHWGHHWSTDFLYSKWEIERIGRWFEEFGLKLLDLHASAGMEKYWMSLEEHERLAGVELVENRINMAAELSTDVIILHMLLPLEGDDRTKYRDQARRSLDALEPAAKKMNVRIALENGVFKDLKDMFANYSPDFLGLCYDAGHGNMIADGLDQLESLKERLISIHLHDNDGVNDQHKLLFSGTLDWPRLARVLAESAYKKCVSMEVAMRNHEIDDERQFLAQAFETGTTFAKMIKEQSGAK